MYISDQSGLKLNKIYLIVIIIFCFQGGDMKKSSRELFRLHGWKKVILFFDGYLYLKFIREYVRVIARAFRVVALLLRRYNTFLFLPVIRYVTHRYHGKVMLLSDAEKIINLNVSVEVPRDLAETTVPWNNAYQLIFRHPDEICVVKCACREAKGHDCEPAHKCIIIGEPYVSFMMEHNRSADPKRITRDEALSLLRTCKEKGYITNAYYKDGVGQQMYAICNCCPECCVAFSGHRFFHSHNISESPLGHSGYRPVIDYAKCLNRDRDCVSKCPFGAISISEEEKPVINMSLCMGCGVAAAACSPGAIVMEPCDRQGIALDIHKLAPETAG